MGSLRMIILDKTSCKNRFKLLASENGKYRLGIAHPIFAVILVLVAAIVIGLVDVVGAFGIINQPILLTELVILLIILLIIVVYVPARAARIIRPTEKGLVERNGHYIRFVDKGLVFLIPLIDRLVKVNVTEVMTAPESQVIITRDRLNLNVNMVVSYRLKSDEESVKESRYGVNSYPKQIDILAHVGLRDIIGSMTLEEANSGRDVINAKLKDQLTKQTAAWGIEIVRAELKDLLPPADIQQSMAQILKTENDKKVAVNTAEAVATKASGEKNAAIQKAEGEKQQLIFEAEGHKQAANTEAEGMRQAQILEAEGRKTAEILISEGQAKALENVQFAADTFFKGNAVTLRRLEALETALRNNSKIFLPEGRDLTLIMSDMAGVLPIKNGDAEKSTSRSNDMKPPSSGTAKPPKTS